MTRAKKIILTFLIILSGMTSFVSFSPKAEAIDTKTLLGGAGGVALHCAGVLDKIGGFLGGILPGGEVPVKEKAERNKEGCLDQLAFIGANILIEETIKSTTDWINGRSGGGGPKYVQNVGQFLEGVTDKTIGEYINTTDFGYICDPFKLQIKTLLARVNIPEKRAACTLSEVAQNIENFIGGDFYDGGWSAWGELVSRSSPYNAATKAVADLEVTIQGQKEIELSKLTWGSGFLSWDTCPGEAYQCKAGGIWYDNVGEAECLNPPLLTDEETGLFTVERPVGSWLCRAGLQTNTPGSVINEQLNKVLGSGQNRIEQADEINELISGLLSKLIGDIFSDKGLFGFDPRARAGSEEELLNFDSCEKYGICDAGETAEEICAYWNISIDECVPGTTVEVCRERGTGAENIGVFNNSNEGNGNQICVLIKIPNPDENPTEAKECSDGIDNDGDGKIDLFDSGCRNLSDNTEASEAGETAPPACSDGKDNDSDGLIDFPADSGCLGAGDKSEKEGDGDNDNNDNGGGGSTSFSGDNPSPKAPKTLNDVVWLHTNISAWKEASKLNKSNISIKEGEICLDHTKKGLWPEKDGVEGNPWVLASIEGKWYAGTYEWLRPGQVCKELSSNPPASTVKELIGPHVKASPLQNWKPRKGELVGFMVSALARDGSLRNVQERTNAVFIEWPF
ncbi:hypothetical protein COV42_01955 [Candidatus Campbellbacteria bacterium CG11_big_fil_rev_8_21_14_0_20_44_21]|uniref:Uncharacterized protein n=1 Tax=Candidatus Campbellbacteria bacterium CG22_combo_CG10-13_8_21_14_all_43_18 TaxID=1974530 RepID=A0A2H0DVY5_9BACT|nr:MAG: hypothetical protein COW82_02490 [Candidatus Campbellbacteria bacterium CG22_combo_CG10-13_8_21_14_all_43_18]PIR24191.1 MAG: hypothetical protein COV42_01955 [Candidatus Campbellbacteria bacterium CG11_big_fil_rev_8_21_14_0_20_44_21]